MSELLERILSKENMNAAYKRVCANKGAGGIDEVTVEELGDYIKENWDRIREQIRHREYNPMPVRRVEVPKPNGGKRKLGIPTAMDRVIQQGIIQVISPMCEPLFSEWSYGFRPNRSYEMAVRQLLVYMNEGYEWIVDIDLEKFFDNVPQDRLMSLVHEIINDGDTESLIRKYLKAGVKTAQGYEETRFGTPQGGNLSPLLSNIMLNELDKELEARGLRFTRYADDCVIAVRSECETGYEDSIGLDTKETGLKGQHGQNPHHKTAKAEISRIWLLQGQRSKEMEVQTPSGVSKEVQEQAKGTNQ